MREGKQNLSILETFYLSQKYKANVKFSSFTQRKIKYNLPKENTG